MARAPGFLGPRRGEGEIECECVCMYMSVGVRVYEHVWVNGTAEPIYTHTRTLWRIVHAHTRAYITM